MNNIAKTNGLETCFSCNGQFPPASSEIHKYMHSSPGCWAAYGEILAREYQDPGLFQACHRLSVDAYALQHPGDPADARANQSVWIHFASLFLIFERGRPHVEATTLLKTLAGRSFEPPGLPAHPFAITVQDVLHCTLANHSERVAEWARASYEPWSHLAPQVIKMIDKG